MLAGLLTLFLLAQAGVPLTGGFVAKLSVFDAAIDARQYSLALIGMLTTAISAFVYLRVVLTMYAPEPLAEGDEEAGAEAAPRRYRVDLGSGVALTVAAFGVLFLGILPNVVLEFSRNATQLLAAHL
jgi:NADH-quinone oxidoreductase subunit N